MALRKTRKASESEPEAKTEAMGGDKIEAKPGDEPKPKPNMEERIEGLQGWMAELERKQERMTRFGGAAAIVAVLAAGGAIALGVINQQNAASEDDVDELTEQVNELGASLKSGTEKQLKALGGRIDGLEQQIATLQQTQATNTQDIAKLKSNQATAAATGKAAAGLGVDLGPAAGGKNPRQDASAASVVPCVSRAWPMRPTVRLASPSQGLRTHGSWVP